MRLLSALGALLIGIVIGVLILGYFEGWDRFERAVKMTLFGEPSVVSRATFDPKTVVPRTKRVYVREYDNWSPPNGEPIFYVPYPNTLCMLGEGPNKTVRIVYQRRPGACEKLVEDLQHQIKHIKIVEEIGRALTLPPDKRPEGDKITIEWIN